MKHPDLEYLNLVQRIFDEGVTKKDRTGTGTISLFGPQMEFDLSKGFPLLTTKRVPFRLIVAELLWFINGDTNLKTLLDKNVHIWDGDAYRFYKENGGTLEYDEFLEYAQEHGFDLGPIYGKQLRNLEHSYWVAPKIYEPTDTQLDTDFDKTIIVDYNSGTSKFLGETFSTEDGLCTVIKEVPKGKGRVSFIVKFHDTGYEKEVRYHQVQDKKIKDPYAQSVFGVGRYGEYIEDEYTPMLKNVWRDMLRRCYNKNSKSYTAYGAKGVHVDKDWLTFSNFNKDVRKLTNWSCKIEYPKDYTLDKDVRYASNRYSKHTCMWSSKVEQSYNTSTNRPFVAVSPKGESVLFRSVGEASRKFGLNLSAIHRCLNEELKTHKGWSNFSYVSQEGKVLRTRVIDQLKEVIAEIKHNPNSRRLVISLYNHHEIDQMVLPPCHGAVIQFFVENNTLHCKMYQRSSDTFLGNPFNIASYALLTHLVAKMLGLKVGKLIHTLGDAHIYLNHVEQLKTQLQREPKDLPELRIKTVKKYIEDYTEDDIELIGYDPHGPIKGKVSVGL